jgi:hypothetical protein
VNHDDEARNAVSDGLAIMRLMRTDTDEVLQRVINGMTDEELVLALMGVAAIANASISAISKLTGTSEDVLLDAISGTL